MRWCRLPLCLMALAGLALPASAGIFFNKHPKPNPSERVPLLLADVKSDPNERKRESAAEELRQFDPKLFPEIVPVLVEVSQQDRSSSVRFEALKTLSKLRPISQEAGWALDQAVSKDPSMRNRLQAR